MLARWWLGAGATAQTHSPRIATLNEHLHLQFVLFLCQFCTLQVDASDVLKTTNNVVHLKHFIDLLMIFYVYVFCKTSIFSIYF